MIDVLTEDLIELAGALPPLRNRKTGRPAHVASIYRYVLSGARAADGSRVDQLVARGLLSVIGEGNGDLRRRRTYPP